MTQNNGSDSFDAASSLLVARDLQMLYGDRMALRGLSFTLLAGRVLGFLGPNGAGKTTSIRILTTMLEPTAGHFSVDGIGSEYPEQIRRKIGVLPEGLGFPKHSTAIEYLIFYGQLYGRAAKQAKEVGLELLQDVGLQNRADSPIGTYSHGMRQRLGIARALVNDPRVVFLDEPTLGLDPRGQKELLGLIQRIARERGAGVILSSHLLSEIEGICDDVVIMSAGRVVARGTVSEVIGQAGVAAQQNVIRLRVAPMFVAQAAQVLTATPNVSRVTVADETAGLLTVELVDRANGDASHEMLAKNKILEALLRAEIPISSFETMGGRLQDVFLQLTAEAIE